MKKIYVTWKDFDYGMNIMCDWIRKQKIKAIIAVPNGGLCMGVVISNKLNIPLYFNTKNILERYKIDEVCIIDDICDSGETLKKINNKKIFKTATFYKRYNSLYEPDFYLIVCFNKSWIVFPWENKDKECKRDNTL